MTGARTGRERINAVADRNGWKASIWSHNTYVRGPRTVMVIFTPRGSVARARHYWQDNRLDVVVYGEQDKAARVIAWLNEKESV